MNEKNHLFSNHALKMLLIPADRGTVSDFSYGNSGQYDGE